MESVPLQSQESHMPWTTKDIAEANQFFEARKTFSGTFNESKNSVARAIGYKDGYDSMPKGVKSYISHVASENRNRRRQEILANEPIQQTPEQRWEAELLASEDMQHALHPEDEAVILEAVRKSE